MGYYTKHKLQIIEGDVNGVDHEQGITYSTIYSSDLFKTEKKWYDCHEDMIAYSRLYPNTVFCITGEGEDEEDLWKEYFKNGKSQLATAKITFDDYDEDLIEQDKVIEGVELNRNDCFNESVYKDLHLFLKDNNLRLKSNISATDMDCSFAVVSSDPSNNLYLSFLYEAYEGTGFSWTTTNRPCMSESDFLHILKKILNSRNPKEKYYKLEDEMIEKEGGYKEEILLLYPTKK